MPRLLVLEWDRDEIRALVANVRGDQLLIEEALVLPVNGAVAVAADNDHIGQQLATALAERGIRCKDAMVAIGRTGIELRLLSCHRHPMTNFPSWRASRLNRSSRHWEKIGRSISLR